MGFLRTLSFTLCITTLLVFVLTASIVILPLWQQLLIFAVLGLLFYFVFGPEEALHELGILFITSAVVLILTGFLGNMAIAVLNAVRGRVGDFGAGQLSALFGQTNVLLGLVLLFIGMFGPAAAFLQFKEKQKIEWGIFVRSAISVGLVYLLAFLVSRMVLARIIGMTAVGIG